jgi:transcriptional regulator with XRE-family HTH domain
MQTIGDRVREARDRKLWTQRELSEATGIMEATISRIENGKYQRRPYRETLEALADALGVSVAWLVFGEDEQKTSGPK